MDFTTPIWGTANGRSRPYSTMTANIEEVLEGSYDLATITIVTLGALYINELTGEACWNAGGSLDDYWRMYAYPGDELLVWLSRHPFRDTPKSPRVPSTWTENWMISLARFVDRDPQGALVGLSMFWGVTLLPDATPSLRSTGKAPVSTFSVLTRQTGENYAEVLQAMLAKARAAEEKWRSRHE